MGIKREKLVAARDAANLSQQELADAIGCSREIVSLWERGLSDPQGYWVRKLCEFFEKDPSDLDIATKPATSGRYQCHRLPGHSRPSPLPATARAFISSSMTARLLQIAHTDHFTSAEITAAMQSTIKDFNTMNSTNPTYPLTRRDAFCSLATFPMIILGQGDQSMPIKRYGEMLRSCTAALEACWQLYRESDASGTRIAFDCTCTYVPLLETIARDSAQYRKEALDLAVQYALLQTLLSWNCTPPYESVSYAQKALNLSKAGGDILLRLSAYTKLNWTYVRSNMHTEAWKTIQEGEYQLREYLRKKNGPTLPSGIIGNLYSGYSTAQVKNGISPDYALGIATDSEPLSGNIAMVEFTADGQWWEAAWTCVAKGDPAQAMMWIRKLIDTETLVTRQGVPQNESDRIGIINIMTSALLQSSERNLEKIIQTWQAGMKGAHALKHEVRYLDAKTNFDIMQALYPGEDAIRKLAPLTAHW